MVIINIKTELFEIQKNHTKFCWRQPQIPGLTSLFYLHRLWRWTELRLNNFSLRSSFWHFLPLRNFLWLKCLYFVFKIELSTRDNEKQNSSDNKYFFMIILSDKYLHYEWSDVETFYSSCVYTCTVYRVSEG